MKKAFITGITGQDGSYLTELLLSKGYEVYGLIRRSSSLTRTRIDHIQNKDLHLIYGDMTDTGSLLRIIKKVSPDEVYHLAAQSHVQVSFDVPDNTFDVNSMGTVRLLEAIRIADSNPCIYNAATSELFGGTKNKYEKLNEDSPFHPRSPYAISKLYSLWMMRMYRQSYGLKIWNGIMFNHESPRRGENFVTRKITNSIARILAGKQDELVLGNLDARRDWGYAPEYCKVMWMMLQSGKPDDYVCATGKTHSVYDFLEEAMRYAGREVTVRISEEYQRPSECLYLCGNASKIERELGWKPKTQFKELVGIMMQADLDNYGVKRAV